MSQVACIILNYRDAKSALKAVHSVRASLGVRPQILVVDNASGDGSAEFLARSAEGAFELIANPENLGYAGGMNAGIRQALEKGADFLWLLTQDMTVESDALKTLLDLWPRLNQPGMLGSLTDFNGTEKVYFYRSFIEGGQVRHRTKGRSIPEIADLKNEYGPTDYVNGACVFTHRSVLEKVGLVPEEYFMYFEDSEWGLRAQRAGFKNYVSYRSRAHHWRDSAGFNNTAEYYCRRNAFLFKQRNGFAKPWTKTVELARLLKYYWKGRFKLLLKPNDPHLTKLVPVLKEVYRDLQEEHFGKRRLPTSSSAPDLHGANANRSK
jgi:GT2 family glycosyltransferase